MNGYSYNKGESMDKICQVIHKDIVDKVSKKMLKEELIKRDNELDQELNEPEAEHTI